MSEASLTERHCQPLEKGTPALTEDQVTALLKQVHDDWSVLEDQPVIRRTFRFKNYYQTIAFVNALAWVAHEQDHHPDMVVSYNRCQVDFSTHSIGGLSDNDFICAARIDALVADDR